MEEFAADILQNGGDQLDLEAALSRTNLSRLAGNAVSEILARHECTIPQASASADGQTMQEEARTASALSARI